MHEIIERLGRLRIIPVVVMENAKKADPLAEALLEGGLPCAEVTFRTEAALETIRGLARRGDLLVGGGTVLTLAQAKAAIDAGARFIVSPGLHPKIVRYCLDRQIAVTPGACTPTDILAALDFGLDVVKFFPAETYGGVKTLKALSEPFRTIKFIPTGGIGPATISQYLAFPRVLACSGSWMVKAELISSGKFSEIARLTRAAVDLASITDRSIGNA